MIISVKSDRIICLISAIWFIHLGSSVAQEAGQIPSAEKLLTTLQWLASPALAGRETGTRGSDMAAGYIASQMQRSGLSPWNKPKTPDHDSLSGYFQKFLILRFTHAGDSVFVFPHPGRSDGVQLTEGKDFTTENIFSDISLKGSMAFAGYGIRLESGKYNDYESIDAKGKIIVILEGYPGARDTAQAAWKTFRKLAAEDGFDLSARSREAYKQGAAALLVIPERYLTKKSYPDTAGKRNDLPDPDPRYLLYSSVLPADVPVLRLTLSGTRLLEDALHFNLKGAGRQINLRNKSASSGLNRTASLKINVKVDTLVCNNVVGILPGRDTAHCIILGAHYDHLGQHDTTIYYGSDDNASGVAGLLSLASIWGSSRVMPACPILFASWTAEEKGLLGSEYFVSQLLKPARVKLYINMDMISRSEKTDSTCTKLSIGTRTADEYLREQARKYNVSIDLPFDLDLWDVTGRHGSDYASFTAGNIPILTFNTGLHEDYHTPRDVPAAADLNKMRRVITLVNLILTDQVVTYTR